MIKRLLLTFMLGVVAMSGFAQFSGGGSGTSTDPYIIYNAAQLDQVRNFLNDENVYFKLGANIDLKEFIAGENPIQGWLPIGTSSAPFKGSFNGNNKTISNLTITRATTNFVGLFGYATGGMTNIVLENVNVSGQNYTGTLVGYTSGTMSGITVHGLNVTGGDYTAGIAGHCGNNITSVTIDGNVIVSGSDYTAAVAGCFASDNGLITGITLTKPTITGSSSVGLICGKADSSTTITNSNITNSSITGSGDYVSAGVGQCLGTLTMNNVSYNNPKVTGSNYVGVAAGWTSGASLSGVNSVGTDITATQYVGGLIGKIEGLGSFEEPTITVTDPGTNVLDNTAVYYSCLSEEGKVVRSAAEKNARIGSTYVPWIACTKHDAYWHLHYNNITRKVNIVYKNSCVVSGCNVDGVISSEGFCGSIVGTIYINNITTRSSTVYSESTTENLGTSGVTAQYYVSHWSTISSGFLYSTTTEETLLYPEGNAKVSSCKSNTNITSSGPAGGIVGTSSDITLNNCEYRGTIKGPQIGGIIGFSNATSIKNCHSYGSLIGTGSPVGGIVGQQAAILSLENCFSSMDMKGGSYSGGLIGKLVAKGVINDSYFSGNILNSASYAGGIIGYNTTSSTAINRCYSHSHLIAATEYVGGIVGNGTQTVKSCAAINDIISVGPDGSIYRIMPSGTAGTSGTTDENKAWVMTTMKKNGVALELPADDAFNGTSVGTNTLKGKATYLGMGWTFDDANWLILNTESFPYLIGQTAPPYITSEATEGMTTLSGRTVEDGTVYVTVGDSVYTTTSSNNNWSVTIKPLAADGFIGVSAQAADKSESYPSFTAVEKATGPVIEPQEGDGTAESPYLIKSANQLQAIKSGDYYYKLANDIDVTDWIAANSTTEGWLPVGTYSNGVSFIEFDGDGHKVYGLWCNRNIEAVGLFGNIVKGDVKNLKVETASGKTLKGGDTTQYLGGLAGIMTGNLSNDTVNVAAVTGTYASTLVGKITGNVTDCYAEGSVSDATYAGALAGYITGKTTSSSAISNVAATTYAGGIAGYATSAIEDVDYEGEVSVTGTSSSYAGGIAGYTAGAIAKSHSNATITGGLKAGGAAGYASGAITETYTEGTITTSVAGAYAAGIVGHTTAGVSDCYTTMTVTATADDSYATGIASYNTKTVARCYSLGNIAGYKASGIVNVNYGSTAIIKNNAALCPTINGKNVALRVLNSYANGAPEPDQTNKAIDNMAVSVNNVPQSLSDDPMNGYAFPEASAKTKTFYTGLGWDFENTWTMGESGYPELKCFATKSITPGDVNNDGNITMSDVVTIISHIMGTTLEGFNADAADLSGDSKVTLADVVLIIDKIMGKTSAQSAPLRAKAFYEAGELYASNYNAESLTLGLSNATSMTAVQMDITLPEDVKVENVSVSPKHIATWTTLNSGKTRLIIYSPSNKVFASNDIATLHFTGNATSGITIENITECTTNAQEFELADLALGEATAIRDLGKAKMNVTIEGNNLIVNAPEKATMNIVTLSGQSTPWKVNEGRNVRTLTPGVYVVNGKKYIVK